MSVYKYLQKLLCCAALAIVLGSCDGANTYNTYNNYNKDELWNHGFNSATKFAFETYYLWRDTLPETITATAEDPTVFLDRLLYTKDKEKGYTFFIRTADYQIIRTGIPLSAIHGFAMAVYNDKFYLTAVYPDSKAAEAGIERGYRLVEIGGKSVGSDIALENVSSVIGNNIKNTLTFEKSDGTRVTVEELEKSIAIRPFVDEKTVIDGPDAKKIGYIEYNSFSNADIKELLEAIVFLNENNIDELILDLRYNRGGYLNNAIFLASAIVQSSSLGEVCLYLKYPSGGRTYRFYTEEELKKTFKVVPLDLSRVFILTTGQSASASEVMIKSLESFIEVHHIGTKTFGKPIGQNIYTSHEEYGYMLYLAAFSLFNQDAANDDFDESHLFYDGIEPHYKVGEFREVTLNINGNNQVLDVLEPFGSIDDPLVAAALHYIETGTYPPTSSDTVFLMADQFIEEPVLMMENQNENSFMPFVLLLSPEEIYLR